MTDMDATDPPVSTFWDELHEISGDLVPDLSTTFVDIDRRVGVMVNGVVQDIIRKSKGDPGVLITDLSSAMLWWFMVGREHAQRGYASPIGKSDTTDDFIPDDASELDPNWEDPDQP